jgi:D-amino-acid dehydrogenase
VFYNTGHGHLGWTLCAVTADMVAEVVQQHGGTVATSAPTLKTA